MHKCDIDIQNISKIEGHTDLHLRVRKGKVTECKLKIDENKRFFKQAVEGKPFAQVPQIMSRICGTCSSAHTLASIESIEKALKIKPTEQTQILKNLLINSGHFRDHAMHLYFFVLPDVYKKDSVLEFEEPELHELVHDGLECKEAGNYTSTIVGGRAIHPPAAQIGGFSKTPTKEEIQEAKNKLKAVRKKVIKLIDIFYNDQTSFKRKTNYIGLVNENYNFLEGRIKTAKGMEIPEKDFGKYIEEVILPYATSAGVEWKGNEYMVGSLARLNLNKENLNKKTLKDVKKYLDIFPNDCIFNNNTAQAIEMLHALDNSLEMLDYEFKEEKPIQPKNPDKAEGKGVGVVEAPRGTLYYIIEIKNGKIKYIDLCIPTQQNIIHIEKDIAAYVNYLLEKKEKINKKNISLEIEKMIRAYDPCMSCATHFLKVNWDEDETLKKH